MCVPPRLSSLLPLALALWAGERGWSAPATTELAARSKSGEPEKLFTSLPASQSGIDAINPIDTKHPLKRLYTSAFGGGGVAAGDFDADGRCDLYFVFGARENRLYLNKGDGSFVDDTETAGVSGGAAWGAGAASIDLDADGDGHDSDAHGGTDCDDSVSTTHPGSWDVGGDGVDSDCDGWDEIDTGSTYVDSYTGGGYTVYKLSLRHLPDGDAALWCQEACEAVDMVPVSCDPWGTTGGPVWGSTYDASAFGAVELPYFHYSCNVSGGITGLTGWDNIITYHNPYSDDRGVCERDCTIIINDRKYVAC